MSLIKLYPEDVLLGVEAASSEEVLKLASEHLLAEGKVKPEYEEHILAREAEYPTGLDLGGTNVAIPHTDWQYANTTQLLVVTLAHPVTWHNMEDSDETLQVSAAVLSVFDKAEHQLEALQQIMGVLQHQDQVKKLVGAKDPQEVVALFEGTQE